MAQLILATTHPDPRGKLTVIDNIIPFEIKRVFYIYNVTDERGGHGHKVNRSALFCAKGKCRVRVNRAGNIETFELDSPEKILILEPEEYRTMFDFSEDAVLMVLASEHYSADDYFNEEPK